MGSEMCIRDRACNFKDDMAKLGLTTGMAGKTMVIQGLGNVGAFTGTCLLYTSDAADERSSVDLGGRRIIKKKKSEWRGNDSSWCNTKDVQ